MRHPLENEPEVKRSHQWIDERDLAMARLIARKIRRNPRLFQEAVETLRHWKRMKPVPEAILEWDRIFKRHSAQKILQIFTENSEEGRRRRQSDPFCGILTHEESIRFLDEYEKKAA